MSSAQVTPDYYHHDVWHVWIIQANGIKRQIETRRIDLAPDELAAKLVGADR